MFVCLKNTPDFVKTDTVQCSLVSRCCPAQKVFNAYRTTFRR